MHLVNFTPLVPTELGAWWVPEPILTFSRREKNHFSLPRIALRWHKVIYDNKRTQSAVLFTSSARLTTGHNLQFCSPAAHVWQQQDTICSSVHQHRTSDNNRTQSAVLSTSSVRLTTTGHNLQFCSPAAHVWQQQDTICSSVHQQRTSVSAAGIKFALSAEYFHLFSYYRIPREVLALKSV
jgi:hypothetical protein